MDLSPGRAQDAISTDHGDEIQLKECFLGALDRPDCISHRQTPAHIRLMHNICLYIITSDATKKRTFKLIIFRSYKRNKLTIQEQKRL